MKKEGFYTTALALFVVLFFASIVVSVAVSSEKFTLVWTDIIYVLFALLPAVFGVCALRAVGLAGSEGKFLLFLTISAWLEVFAEFAWSFQELVLGIINPYPSIADALWLLTTVTAVIAFVFALVSLKKFITAAKVVPVVVSVALFSGIIYLTVLLPIFADAEAPALVKFISAAYPIGDIIIAGLALLMFLVLYGSPLANSWSFFNIGFALIAISDLIYTFQLYSGTYEAGVITDIILFAVQIIIAAAYFQQIQIVGEK